jgi:undecaprenyl-diphosphatase
MSSNFIEIIILSLVQGISEFLPISSSSHLIIVSSIYEFQSSSLLIDVSLHLGSLLAIIFFFRKDLLNLHNNKKILLLIIVGSIPLILFGYILYKTEFIYFLRDIKIIAWASLIFGMILYFADKNNFNRSLSTDLNLRNILYIGLFQVLALVPGVSRAGITITAARIFKFNRVDASKISFLLAIPALSGASVLNLKNIFEQSVQINYLVILAIILSFAFSYLTIKFFLKYIKKFSLNIFVIYRIFISLLLFFIIYN